jgi:hypothetical protein
MTKQQYNINADAHLAFSGPRRNGPPIVLPVSRIDVAREVRFARNRGLPMTKTSAGYNLGSFRFVRA